MRNCWRRDIALESMISRTCRRCQRSCVKQQYWGFKHCTIWMLRIFSLSLRMNVDFRNDSLVSCNWSVASNWYHLSSSPYNDAVINPQFIALTVGLHDKGWLPLRGTGQNRPRRCRSGQSWPEIASSLFVFVVVRARVRYVKLTNYGLVVLPCTSAWEPSQAKWPSLTGNLLGCF